MRVGRNPYRAIRIGSVSMIWQNAKAGHVGAMMILQKLGLGIVADLTAPRPGAPPPVSLIQESQYDDHNAHVAPPPG